MAQARARSTMSDFEILDRLGSGSFGTVFKVKRLEDNDHYVIKTVRVSELSRREQQDAINEVTILAQLESPYVVRYFDSFMDTESLHIVMEYCNRGDLQSLIRKAKDKKVTNLKAHVTWDLTLQILLGLHYLHGKKILHRDLKSANVFLMKNGKDKYFGVKIGDLGVAKLLETSTAFAQTIVGTPYYLSPELCADKPYRDKSDCWALGVLLYECCTLRHPFEARNQCALIMKIMGSKVEPPDPKLVSSELSALCLWLLNKDPEKRPTIKEILNESVVRAELEKHELPLPYELHEVEPSYKLERLAASVASPSGATRAKSASSSSSGVVSTSAPTSTATSSPSAATSSRANNSSAVPPVRLPERGGGNSGVMGNRVRGGGARAQRQPSKTAMERYQVKQTPLEQHAQATRQQEQMHRISGQLNDEGKLECSDQHMRTHMESSSKDVDVGLDRPMDVDARVLAEAKGVDAGADTPAAADDKRGGAVPTAAVEAKTGAVPSSGDDADYDIDDFEEYESDFEADVSSGDAAAAVNDRGAAEDLDTDLGELGGDETQVKLLESLVREAREKSLASLGTELFEKVYALCSEHMGGEINEEGSAVGDGGSTVSGSSFVAELEEALCQQLKGGVDVACEAVFGVKVLLALESKVTCIERKQEGDAISGSHK